ncbi:DUF2963 domain-containing protein [Candidatus Phytoplasma pini]|uniref:DUF2963 domain-containing protein n=1 Tax=Candidatus Phytoplasma pini TaxID=267362 RepID=A0A559KIX1_9MOLU|nr:hypothetical protein [Candidatus Phytoplasma pini]TVY12085.1 hypothetical protein MDPP_00372 [Candidatus Phytoplasma pini]
MFFKSKYDKQGRIIRIHNYYLDGKKISYVFGYDSKTGNLNIFPHAKLVQYKEDDNMIEEITNYDPNTGILIKKNS